MDNAQANFELEEDISRYLATGDSDVVSRGVPGSIVEAMTTYDQHLRDALLAEVQRREADHPGVELPPGWDLAAFTRRKVEPIILTEAANARNGWKGILARCSNPKRARHPSVT